MGRILKDLSRTALPDRESHNSRMFVDLCENIHIHYRELRIVFSLDEYFEFVDILQRSTDDVRNYLAQNPDYTEGAHNDTLMVAGGKARQRKLLEHSPEPNRSTYFNNAFAIELQEETVTDEIHVHWRDYRFSLDRDTFKQIATCFEQAKQTLGEFEGRYNYQRQPHRDRTMDDMKIERARYEDYYTGLVNEQTLPLDAIHVNYDNFFKNFQPDPNTIKILKDAYSNGTRVFPIVLSTEQDGTHMVIDGHHRLYAAKCAGRAHIPCVVTDLTYEDSYLLRRSESILKEFDRKTNQRYGVSDFTKQHFAYKLGRFYRDNFVRALNPTRGTKAKLAWKDLKRALRRKSGQSSWTGKVLRLFFRGGRRRSRI
jgi:hypothetical protein